MSAATKLPYTRVESTANLARRLYDASGGDEQATINALVANAQRRPSLATELIEMAARALVGQIRRAANQELFKAARPAFARVDDAAVRSAGMPTAERLTAEKVNVVGIGHAQQRLMRSAVSLRGLFGFKIAHNGNSKPLGEATRADLMPVVSHYEEQGADMLRKGRWLRQIMDAIPDNTPVSMVLTEEQVRAMKTRAEKSLT